MTDGEPGRGRAIDADTADAVSLAVVEEIAAVGDASAAAVPPLYESVDPDALESLVGSADGGLTRIVFSHAGYEVTVHGDGSVNVVDPVGR